MRQLVKQEITSILIEGGAKTIGYALAEGVVDKMLTFIAFKIMGDQTALSSIVGLKAFNVNRIMRLSNLNITVLGEDLLVEGYVHRNY